MTEPDDVTAEALEQIDYLTSSHNRLQVLQALTETASKPSEASAGREPRALEDETDASEATVSRILNEFQERGWASRSAAGGYVATGLGTLMASHFDPFHRSVQAIVELEEVAELVPVEELTIDLRHFRDATVRRPQGPPQADFCRYYNELLAETTTLYFMTDDPVRPGEFASSLPDDLDAVDTTGILPESVRELLRNSREDREAHLALVDAGNRFYTYEGAFPCSLNIFDDVVLVGKSTQTDSIGEYTVIESRNEVVREWALEMFERYVDEATELTHEDSVD